MEFDFERVHNHTSNGMYEETLKRIKEIIPIESKEDFANILLPLAALISGHSHRSSTLMLEFYKNYLQGTYPELKRYKL